MSIRRIAALAAVLAALVAVSAPAALAKDGDVRVRGTCTAASTAKLKLSDEDGRIEVEFEVDQNRNGVTWQVTIHRNGTQVASTTATTRPPSGSFEVRRVIADAPGTDRVVAAATSPSGERCTAQASF
jgi:type 1 fimbria pilin